MTGNIVLVQVQPMPHDPIDLHIGDRLQSLREEKGVALQFVSACMGISYQQIRKYEKGHSRMSANTLFRLSGIFGVEPGYFFSGLPRQELAAVTPEVSSSVETEIEGALRRIPDQNVREKLAELLTLLASEQASISDVPSMLVEHNLDLSDEKAA